MDHYYAPTTTRDERRKMTNTRVPFRGKMLVLGCGAVARCTLPLLPRLIDMPLDHITVLDMVDNRRYIQGMLDRGVKYVVEKIDRNNLVRVISHYLSRGDFLMDLAWEIDTCSMLRWCREHGVLYMNASLEIWEPYADAIGKDPRQFTLYWRHMRLREMIASWGDNNGPTAVIDHGANPGLVSHFTKQALEDIANKLLADNSDTESGDQERLAQIKEHLDNEDWPRLAMTLGVKVIHISERDTQITRDVKKVNEFVNTWSPEGFYEEGVAPAELGWGTHEKTLPDGAMQHSEGPRNQICLRGKGMNTYVRSWVPTPNDSGDILGMVIRHGEAFTISDKLTVWEEESEDDASTGGQKRPIYRPTVHYAYCPCNEAIASMFELKMRHYKMHDVTRVMQDDIVKGQDILGCLLMGHDYKAWWIGSMLDIEETRELAPHQNATTLQVAISMAAAAQWAIENPNKGVCVPDDLPHRRILRECYPFLGPFLSVPVDWTPLQGIRDEAFLQYRPERAVPPPDEDVWQFTSFLFNDS